MLSKSFILKNMYVVHASILRTNNTHLRIDNVTKNSFRPTSKKLFICVEYTMVQPVW